MASPSAALTRLQEVLDKDLTSVEIIPGDWADWRSTTTTQGSGASAAFPFLHVEGNLGIPHKVAYRLYVAASSFTRLRKSFIVDKNGVADTVQKTAVILIVNPAHQTALNTRKNLIERGVIAADRELRFTELLLRGVKVCAKESALWSHRRWCLHFLHGSASGSVGASSSSPSSLLLAPAQTSLVPILPTDAVVREFATVKQAVTLYPRSYHAWTHWRYTFDVSCALLASISAPKELRDSHSKIVFEEFKAISNWIQTHTSDTSAVHHLVSSLPTIWNLAAAKLFSSDVCIILEEESSPLKLAKDAWQMLSTFQPYRETGWIYLAYLLDYLPTEKKVLYRERMLALDTPWDIHRKHLLTHEICIDQ